MPRKARIDTPGALHYIIVRGIERRSIFYDDLDRENFIERFGIVLTESDTPCFAWALIPNHFHLLLKTGTTPMATVMRRLLTGYAVNFNRRHRRHGQLFQNRYKSILCQEDAYLRELVGRVALLMNLEPGDIVSAGKYPQRVKARSLLCYWGARELGVTTVALAEKVNLAQPTVSQAISRGQKIAEDLGLRFCDQINQ